MRFRADSGKRAGSLHAYFGLKFKFHKLQVAVWRCSNGPISSPVRSKNSADFSLSNDPSGKLVGSVFQKTVRRRFFHIWGDGAGSADHYGGCGFGMRWLKVDENGCWRWGNLRIVEDWREVEDVVCQTDPHEIRMLATVKCWTPVVKVKPMVSMRPPLCKSKHAVVNAGC